MGNCNSDDYLTHLNNLVQQMQVADSVHILPPLFGTEKIRKYQEADIFILPTMDENFGMVIAEAMACGVPVITTKGAPWKQLVTNNCGWWIEDNSIENIVSSLSEAMLTPKSNLNEMGKRGRRLIEQEFSAEVVKQKLVKFYHWLHSGDERPDFIITN